MIEDTFCLLHLFFSFNLLLFVIFEYIKKVWPNLDFVVLKGGEMFYQLFQRAVDIFLWYYANTQEVVVY